MNDRSMPSRATALLMSGSLLALTACEEGGNFGSLTSLSQEPGQSESIDIIERDVEKPEIFSQRDMALWDGRPSFGGVWVALPGNIQPERVSVTNVDNGKSVVGALFKREEQNPGPPIRLSSDAAAALEVVPGQPTLVAVTVVRRETFANVPNTPSDSLPADVETEALAPAAGAAETPQTQDAEALANELAATLDEPEAPAADAVATGAAAAGAAAATAAATAPQAEAPRQRRTLMDLFRNRRDDAPASTGGEVISVITPDPEPAGTATSEQPLPIESATIPAASAEPATAAPAPAAPATGSDLSKPFLQTGTFSARENAETQVAQLDAAGVPALIRSRTTDSGKTLFRVLVGPASSESQRDDFAQAARGVGIKDAFATAN